MNSKPFIGEMVSSNVVVFKGIRLETFLTWESDSLNLSAGERVRFLFVPETQQCYILEKIT